MNNNIREKFLPLGTVCMLENGKKPIMIIGYLPQTAEEKPRVFDYTGCIFPEGVMTSSQTAVFNHDQIKEILSLGFENEQSKLFQEKIKELVKEKSIQPTKTDSLPTESKRNIETL